MLGVNRLVNQKGEFPLDAKVSARVTGGTKRLLKKLKSKGHTESDVIEYGAKCLADEPILVDWEIGELQLKINILEAELYDLKARKQAKLNRLKIIAPKMIDEETMNNLMKASAKEYLEDIIQSRSKMGKVLSFSELDNHNAKSSIRATAREWGYDELLFLEEVLHQAVLSDKVV